MKHLRSTETSAALAALSVGLLVASVALLPGCAGTVRRLDRQREWVDLHPKAPMRVRKAVLGKKLVQGMPKGAIVASWGEPDRKLRLGSGDARWTYIRPQVSSGVKYDIEYILVLRRGVLIAVHSQSRR